MMTACFQSRHLATCICLTVTLFWTGSALTYIVECVLKPCTARAENLIIFWCFYGQGLTENLPALHKENRLCSTSGCRNATGRKFGNASLQATGQAGPKLRWAAKCRPVMDSSMCHDGQGRKADCSRCSSPAVRWRLKHARVSTLV